MGYPNYKNRGEIKAAGYTFEGSGECNKCGQPVDWAKTKNGKKVPFDVGSTTCHFDSCARATGQPPPAQQPATSSRPASPIAQEMVVALRALNTNVLALNATMQALLTRLGQRQAAGETDAAGNGNNPEAGALTGVMTNGHGVTVSDKDVPF